MFNPPPNVSTFLWKFVSIQQEKNEKKLVFGAVSELGKFLLQFQSLDIKLESLQVGIQWPG